MEILELRLGSGVVVLDCGLCSKVAVLDSWWARKCRTWSMAGSQSCGPVFLASLVVVILKHGLGFSVAVLDSGLSSGLEVLYSGLLW